MSSELSLEEHPLSVTKVSTPYGTRNIAKNRSVHRGSCTRVNQFPVVSSLGNLFVNGSQVTCDLRSPSITFVKRIVVGITVQNNSAGTITLLNSEFLFNQVQIYIGSEPVYNLYPENMWYSYIADLDTEKATLLAAAQNWSPSTYVSTANTITTGQSATYYIPIDCFLNQCDYPLDFGETIRFQFYMTNAPYTSTSAITTTSTLAVTNFQLYVIGDELSPAGHRALEETMKSGTYHTHCYIPDRQVLNVGTCTTSSTVSQTLTGLNGKYSMLQFYLRQANATNENIYQFDHTNTRTPSQFALAQQNLTDSKGRNFYVSQMDDQLIRLAMGYTYQNSIFDSIFRRYNYLFTDEPSESLLHGYVSNQNVENTWQFRFVPSSLSGSTNCDLVILSLRYSQIDIDPNGRVTVRQY